MNGKKEIYVEHIEKKYLKNVQGERKWAAATKKWRGE